MSTNTGRAGKSSSTHRRKEIRRRLPRSNAAFWTQVRQPTVIYGAISCLVFVILLTILAGWADYARRPFVGKLVYQPIVNLLDFETEDPLATNRAKLEARRASPLIFTPEIGYLDRLQAAIDGLPRAIADRTSIEEVNPDLVKAFALTPETLAMVRSYVGEDGTTNPKWITWTKAFTSSLWRRDPLLSTQDFQAFATTLNKAALIPGENKGANPSLQPLESAMEIGEKEQNLESVRMELELLARQAGFPRDLTMVVAQRVIDDPQPTALIDRKRTDETAEEAAMGIEPIKNAHRRGEVIALPGEVLSRNQVDRIDQAMSIYRSTSSAGIERLVQAIGVAGMAIGLCALLAAYAVTFYPRIARNTLRFSVMLGMVLAATVIATVIGVELPSLFVLGSLSAALVVVIIIALTYDRRLAFFVAIAQSLMVAIVLQETIGMVVAQIITCATMAAMLKEIRNRRALIRASSVTAFVGATMFVLPNLTEIPTTVEAWWVIMINAASGISAAYLVGFMMLGALPSIERMFDLTTGLTLSELRDPRHPLLRQMQQRAPGTYNHSLQIANIAEAAAEAINGDGLLVYVGALYHDIGKINKPEYFIENQAGGPNKHDKLSPAMSLLVITGHVKDGVELAREYGLPKVLIHFVESHHGTTLVEYFFHAARTKAEEEGAENTIEEFDFRYPGPKPRTREAAILMLCDCIESATRAMGEPTPSRIETLVRTLSRKRLEDRQFDECPLSFKELRTVEDSIIKSLSAIYHGRIAYPSKHSEASETQEKTSRTRTATA
jgi:putative nucleotidyltransferase with HDIG domain